MQDELKALHFQSALQIARQIADGRITSREVTQCFLDRIHRANALNAFTVVLDEQALAQADAADRALRSGQAASPLHGVPIVIKDSIEIAGTAVAAGSLSRMAVVSTGTSAVARRLQAAGMVILGKTHMTEFAFGLSGQNPTCGTPWNPWDAFRHRAPGGSSSGAGVAVAAGLAPIALGGDTGGSVRAPATLNHLVGFKPSTGIISRADVVPLAPSLDVLGPICRTVADAHALTTVLAGPDDADPVTLETPADVFARLKGRLASPEREIFVLDTEAFPASLASSAMRAWKGALARLREAGWALTPWTPCAALDIGKLSDDNSLIIGYEGYSLHGQLAQDPLQPIWEVVRHRILAGAKIPREAYDRAIERRTEAAAAFTRAMGATGTLLMPATSHGALPLDPADAGHAGIGKFCRAGNFLGTPAIALPADFDDAGMPVGVQLLAPPMADKALLDQAGALAPVLLVTDRNPDLKRWAL